MPRIQLLTDGEEYDRISAHFYDGARSKIIRNLLHRACDAVEDPNSNITVDSIIRGNFKLEDVYHDL